MSTMIERRKNAEQFLQQASAAQRAGDVSQAIELCQRSLKLCPTAEAHTVLGWAYSLQGKLDEAIWQCECAIALDPEFGNAYNDIGSYLIEKSAYDEAVPYLEKALHTKRCDKPHFARFNLARVFVRRGMLLRAAEEFREALKLEPGFGLAAEGLIKVTEHIN